MADRKKHLRNFNTIYPALAKWCIQNNIYNLQEFGQDLGIKYTTFHSKMSGLSEFRISEAKKIMEKTGLSFEEAFKRFDEE